VLDRLDGELFATLTARAKRLAAAFEKAGSQAGLAIVAPQVGPLVGLYMGTSQPTDHESARATDEAAYARLFHALLDRGVAIAPGAYEVMFPGLAHTDEVIDQIAEAVIDAAEAAAAGSIG
jgi:glutamate-1-semialdehyde 2,1-aminomutase